MRRIVITGGTGLLGSHLLPLLAEEAEVHAVGREPPRAPGIVHHRCDLAEGLDATTLPPAADAVVHLAQSRRFRAFPEQAAHVARINCQSAVELAQYAVRAGASHFLYASTGGVYAPGPAPLAETAPLAAGPALTFYAATKQAGEKLLEPFAGLLNLVVLRPFFLYGRGQDEAMLIPRLIGRVRSGEPIRLAGRDGMRINPLHAADAAAAARAALALEGRQVINLAGAEVLSLRAIGEAIGRAVDAEPRFETTAEAAGGDLVADIAAMRRLLVAPAMSFARGLAGLVGAEAER
jgi:UDP-glucose 4-epimerase